jgi:type II secretory pathway pseudopilin PulG
MAMLKFINFLGERFINYKTIKNENGLTLIELLATILLSSMVIIILMTTLSIGIKYNVSESKKVRLQQEANLVIATITNKHRDGDCYILDEEGEKLFFYKCDETKSKQGSVTENLFNYDINTNEFSGNPKKDDLEISLTVIDPVNEKLRVTINSTISRVKTDN